MMDKSPPTAHVDTDGGYELHRVEDTMGFIDKVVGHRAHAGDGGYTVMQEKPTTVASGKYILNENLMQNEDVPEDALGRCKLECFQKASDCDSSKGLVPNKLRETVIGNSSLSHGFDLVQDEGSKNLELDKNLPPIKTRREGQAREHSPSDLSPPSPKRLRQGSRESQDQWNGLWNTGGKP